ncbi:GNAT family N-acetyltransferase [Nocardioides sp. HDW12B]|uniref:GNAT family N-acetyltransferase n=1 Tax=Nocardioides sp. HDW12B TaxID=2714939 RepID=UPI0014079574|nr:GNAT family N-acetyltransferase [Nocardioides sp. HDW12B]QIK65491.1 GNAT family N-acetyltransferase [Nocardioides sp. HDW12B]
MRFPSDVPTLTDGVATIRAHRPEDAPAVLEQCLDPVSRQWTTVPLDYTRADADRFVRDIAPGAWRTEAELMFAVEALDTSLTTADEPDGVRRFAGTISLRDEGDDRAELAYGAHPWVRGTGVMERAVRLLLDWGFEERGLRTVVWWANRGNWSSRKLAWRVGFTVEAGLRSWLPQRGELLDAWVGTLRAGDPRRPAHAWLDAPRIVGDGVVLRAPTEADLPRVVEYAADPLTRRWLGHIPQPYGDTEARAWLDDLTERHARGTAVTWTVADPDTDLLLGVVNVFDLTPSGTGELGYVLHPEGRGRGLGRRAAGLALRHAVVDVEDGGLGLVAVRALAAEGNTASRRLLEDLGFTHQGRERRAARVEGDTLADAAIYDVLASEVVKTSP